MSFITLKYFQIRMQCCRKYIDTVEAELSYISKKICNKNRVNWEGNKESKCKVETRGISFRRKQSLKWDVKTQKYTFHIHNSAYTYKRDSHNVPVFLL